MSTLQINKSKYKQFKIAAIGSGAALVLGGLTFFQPFSLTDNSYAGTSSAQVSVNLVPTIAVWTTDTSNNDSDQVDIAAQPDESINTGTIRAHVSTNNITGYTLTIQSTNANGKMTHEDENVAKTINPLTGSGTSTASWRNNSDLNNMWGYSIGSNDSYKGVPGSSTNAATINSTDAPQNDSTADVTFATKADLSLTAGTYTDTVVFSAVANALPTPIIDGMSMQDVTQETCANTPLYSESNTTYTLTDSRDNNEYYVRKLADGNCWMVQNLRLINKAISPSDSDVASNFTVPASSTDWGTSATIDSTGAYSTNNNSYGVYYNWYTATAGTGTSTMGELDTENATASICPKGWRLPACFDGGWYDVAVATFGQSAVYYYHLDDYDSSIFASGALSLPFSGSFRDGLVKEQGTYGRWWSNTTPGKSIANSFSVGSGGDLYVDSADEKYSGASVRCVLASE